ncbi:hypothetical protein PTKU46_64650 [Paraburkholderia terrae]|uniref:hypothetical protein n=1 Tax=Paraburkholderia terrae TaxID=311230 RepID=UPI0030E120B1
MQENKSHNSALRWTLPVAPMCRRIQGAGGNRVELQQVLHNLVVNALESMRGSGRAQLTVIMSRTFQIA